MTTEKINSIALIRSVAMLLIVLTHFLNEIPSVSFAAQATNAAVYTFLFLSGFLYGTKATPVNITLWYIDKFKKLLIPMYIVVVSVIVYSLLMGLDISLFTLVGYFFNLQYIVGSELGLGHLWFMTVLMICYAITPFLSYINKSFFSKSLNFYILLSLVLLVGLLSLHSVKYAQAISYVGIYVFAFSASNIYRDLNKVQFAVFSVVVILAVIFRVFIRMGHDNTSLYDGFVVPITQFALGIYVFIFIDKFSKFILKFDLLNRLFGFFERHSFEVYLIHYPLIVGPFVVWGISENPFIDSGLVFCLSLFLAVLLKRLSSFILDWTEERMLIECFRIRH